MKDSFRNSHECFFIQVYRFFEADTNWTEIVFRGNLVHNNIKLYVYSRYTSKFYFIKL